MSTTDTDQIRLSRQVPLDQLVMPDTDIRQSRPEEAIRSLASSMGDPSVGQLQPVLVAPADADEQDVSRDREELEDYFAEGEPLKVVDGVTRWRAAEYLGWDTIWCWVCPEPPENTVIASLDANTERIQMGEFETIQAIVNHKEETGKTWQEIAEDVGYSPSYLSQVSSALNGPEWLVERWQHPDSVLETGHVLDLMQVMSPRTTEKLQEWGNLKESAAQDKQHQLTQLLADQAEEFEYSVGQLRDRRDNKLAEVRRELTDGRTIEEKQADGQTAKALEEDGKDLQDGTPDEQCLICGSDAKTMVAVPCCSEDYGMLNSAKQNGDVLMAPSSSAPAETEPTADSMTPEEMLQQGLQEAFGLAPEDAAGLLNELQQQAAQAPPMEGDD